MQSSTWPLTRPKRLNILLAATAALLCVVVFAGPANAATSSPTITVSPTAAIVGAKITVTGMGFPPSTSLSLEWASVNASWVVKAIPTPQVTGINTPAAQTMLGSAQTDATGSFSAQIAVPTDYGGTHFIQAFFTNGTALSAKATFIVEPSFTFSPKSGPDGTPISFRATGLGYGLYSTSYYLSWDNSITGYMTALSSAGGTNFTIYASGTSGTHYISIYQGYPGPGYLNPQQGPPSSETQSTFPPYIPFFANFTVTPEQVTPQATTAAAFVHDSAAYGSFALVAALAGGALFIARKDSEERKAISRTIAAVVIVVVVAVAGVGLYAATGMSSSSASTSTLSPNPGGSSVTSSSQSVPQVSFVPQASVVRPHISVPVNSATTGPRISVSPTTASVGDNITVTGAGFTAGTQYPIVWTTYQGSNLLGYKAVAKPLRNVTAAADGSFSFVTKVPPDLGGIHYIAAGNLTENSNGTVFVQRSAVINTAQGPQGTIIQVIMHGVGYNFNTNIVAVDYDNSYIGYACGFNSGGNVTVTIVASGAPGIHTIDVYPSVWWGGSQFTTQQVVEYRFPILTPQDQPALMPSFHFTFLMTSGQAQ
jgi:hypothetical protein